MKFTVHCLFLFISISLNGQGRTILTGTVHNIENDTLIVSQSYKDLRYNGEEIPITTGKSFTYELLHDYTEEYAFVYKSELKRGAWRPILFFPNGERIDFDLYPTIEYDKNKIVGDKLGLKKQDYQNSFAAKFMDVGNDIFGKFFQLEKGTEEYNKTKIRLDSLNQEALKFQHEYFLKDESILGLNEYVDLLSNASQMMIPAMAFAPYQKYYLTKNEDHPLVDRAFNLYTALASIGIGHSYVDVTLKSQEGTTTLLSDIIDKNDRYTLLDLWAPWCGPCISKSKKIKEHYSDFSDTMQVIGIVGGVETVDKATSAIAKFDYPWMMFLEVDDEFHVWEKYGISNAGGSQYLIDTKGKIAAINPTIKEIKELIIR